MSRKLSAFAVIAWVLVVVALVSGYLRLCDAQSAANDAASNLQRLDALKTSITSLRTLEDRAQVQGYSQVDSTKALLSLASNASISETQITEIDRLPLQNLGKSNYQRDDVIIRIRDVSAAKLIGFLINCSDPSGGYVPVSLQLRTVNRSAAATEELWSAELVLTRVLFAAKNPTSDLR